MIETTFNLVPEYDTPGFPRATEYSRPAEDGGAMTLEEAIFLYGLATVRKPRMMVELGTSTGFSTMFLAKAAQECGAFFTTVDQDYRSVEIARTRLRLAGRDGGVVFMVGNALEYIKSRSPAVVFDFVLIDTDLQTREEELWAMWPMLAPDALVAIHDASPDHPLRGSSNVLRALEQAHEKKGFDYFYVPSPRGMAIVRKHGIRQADRS